MTIFQRAAFLAILGTVTSGCLLKDELHTWYVDRIGGVVWVVTEKDVRSDAQAAADRDGEEAAYWASVKSETHHMARGLRLLGAEAMRTRVLRAESPFTVVTEGRFSGLGELGQRLIVHAGLTGSSIVTRPDGIWEWTMTVRDPHATGDSVERVDDGLTALLASLDKLQIVLVSGRFEAATGFDLSSDRRIASLTEEAPKSDETTITLMLRWR
jgi:hypothetical protein